jgi:hypothetical protein
MYRFQWVFMTLGQCYRAVVSASVHEALRYREARGAPVRFRRGERCRRNEPRHSSNVPAQRSVGELPRMKVDHLINLHLLPRSRCLGQIGSATFDFVIVDILRPSCALRTAAGLSRSDST